MRRVPVVLDPDDRHAPGGGAGVHEVERLGPFHAGVGEHDRDVVRQPAAAVGVDDVLQHVCAGAAAREADHREARHQVGIAPARRPAARACHAARRPGRSSGAARASGGKVGSLCGHGGGLPGGGAGDRPAAPDEIARKTPASTASCRAAGSCRARRQGRRSGRQGAELPLPGSKRQGFRANRGRPPRLWSVGRTGRSGYGATQGEKG